MPDLKKVISKASEFEKNQSIAMAKEFIDVKEKIDNIEIPEIPEQNNSDIVEAIEELKEIKPDNSSLENIMQKIVDKKEPEAKEFPKSIDVNVKNQKEFPKVQEVEMSKPKWYDKFNYDTILTGIKSILEKVTIKTKTEETLNVHILDKKGKIIDKFEGGKGTDVQHGGYFSGWLKNVLGTVINPATEEKQDDLSVTKNNGTMSTNNSTTTSLGIDEVFTGVADDIKDYAAINISIFADQASATDGLSIEWSQDGTNWDEKMTVSIGASKAESYEFGVRARYFRLVYTNGATAQGAFRLQVMYHPVRTREGARCLCVDIDSREFAKTVRAVLAAKKPNGVYTNIHATTGGNLKVAVEEIEPTSDTPEFFEDTSFVTGDSPVTLDLNTALGRNATEGTIINDGDGNFTVAFSINGTDFGDEITLKIDDVFNFEDISVDSLRITWVADSAYRVIII